MPLLSLGKTNPELPRPNSNLRLFVSWPLLGIDAKTAGKWSWISALKLLARPAIALVSTSPMCGSRQFLDQTRIESGGKFNEETPLETAVGLGSTRSTSHAPGDGLN